MPNAGLVWHVDVYEGLLDGVILAEVELPDEKTDLPLPGWVGAEVTGRPEYKKINLQRIGRLLSPELHGLSDPVDQAVGGRCCAQGRAASSSAPSRSTSVSWPQRPTICTEVGRPSAPKPEGRASAGWPVRLKGYW